MTNQQAEERAWKIAENMATASPSRTVEMIVDALLDTDKRARESEREACARVAYFYHDENVCSGDSGYKVSGYIAQAIRLRGEKERG